MLFCFAEDTYFFFFRKYNFSLESFNFALKRCFVCLFIFICFVLFFGESQDVPDFLQHTILICKSFVLLTLSIFCRENVFLFPCGIYAKSSIFV